MTRLDTERVQAGSLFDGAACYLRVLDADIEVCSDSIDHIALMDLVRRVKDKRVLRLLKRSSRAAA